VLLEQPAADAVILNVVLCVIFVLLVSMPEIGEPEPFAGIPAILVVLSRVQLKTVPATLLGFNNTIFVIAASEQIV
jgi:hypothetical protein